MGLIILSGSLFFLNETGFATLTEDDLLTAQEELKDAQEALIPLQEAEQKALEARNAKKAEIAAREEELKEKGEALATLQNQAKELENKDPITEEEKQQLNTINNQITSSQNELKTIQSSINNTRNELTRLETAYNQALKNTQATEQKVKEFEANVKNIEAVLCTGTEQECAQMKLNADKANQDANQQDYDKAINVYNACVQQCDDDCEPDDNGSTPYCDETCYEQCEKLKNDSIIYDYEKNQSQILSAEQELYKYQTLKELTFDVESILNIDPMVVGEQKYTAQEKPYFSDTKNTPIFSFILRVIDFAIRIIGSIAVLIIIIAGFILVVSVGNDTRIEQGKNAIKYALMGLAIAFMSYTIVLFVQAIFSN